MHDFFRSDPADFQRGEIPIHVARATGELETGIPFVLVGCVGTAARRRKGDHRISLEMRVFEEPDFEVRTLNLDMLGPVVDVVAELWIIGFRVLQRFWQGKELRPAFIAGDRVESAVADHHSEGVAESFQKDNQGGDFVVPIAAYSTACVTDDARTGIVCVLVECSIDL